LYMFCAKFLSILFMAPYIVSTVLMRFMIFTCLERLAR
jgi:hypothetical protein